MNKTGKRTSFKLTERDFSHVGYLMKKNEDGVGQTTRTLMSHIMKKLIEGDYDEIKLDEKDLNQKLVYADAELRDDAYEKARELGYNSIGEVVGKIIRLEKVRQSKQPKRAEEFSKVGEFEKVASGDNEDEEVDMVEDEGVTDDGTFKQ